MLHFFWNGYEAQEGSFDRYESANDEIAKWAERTLGRLGPFHQSHWAAGRVSDSPDDIFIGHPTWSPERSGAEDWVKANALSPDAPCHPNTYILVPWVPEFPIEWTRGMSYYESQLLSAQKIFAMCGEIWIDKTLAKRDDSVQYRVRDKLVRVDMGVAAQNIGIPKTKFNPPGSRQLLHMSTLGSYKGFDLMCESLVGLPALLNVASRKSFPPGFVERELGQGEKFVFNFLGPIDNADPHFTGWVSESCDFYIHTASMDAQATTILEACARGLVPLVTPESGFESPDAIMLTQDARENRQIIARALEMPEAELLERNRRLRVLLAERHSWDRIFGTVWDGIRADIEARAARGTKS